MSDMVQIINKTGFGLVFKCYRCNKIHIEFNNFNLNFSEAEYKRFSEYIHNLDGEYWSEMNKDCIYRRKIRIPIGSCTTCLMLNIEELWALRRLLEAPVNSAQEKLVSLFKETPSLN